MLSCKSAIANVSVMQNAVIRQTIIGGREGGWETVVIQIHSPSLPVPLWSLFLPDLYPSHSLCLLSSSLPFQTALPHTFSPSLTMFWPVQHKIKYATRQMMIIAGGEPELCRRRHAKWEDGVYARRYALRARKSCPECSVHMLCLCRKVWKGVCVK